MNDNSTPPSPSSNGGMHKQDLRNLIIFLALSLAMWLAYDRFVLKPRIEEMKRQQEITAAKKPAQSPGMAAADTPKTLAQIISEGGRVTIDTPQLAGTISLTGARIDDVELKNYHEKLEGGDDVAILTPAGTEHSYYNESGWIADEAGIALPGKNTVWKKVSGGEKQTPKDPLVLQWDNGAGLVFTRKIEVDADYLFTIQQSVANNSKTPVTLYAWSSLSRKGIPPHSQTVGYEGPIGYVGEDLHEIKYQKLIKDPGQSFEGPNGWIGISEKYWLASVIPDQKEMHSYRFTSVPAEPKENSLFQVDARGQGKIVQPGGKTDTVSHLFVGAKKINTLDMYETKIGVRRLDLAVDFGMLYFLTRPMYFFLTTFYSWVGNFGVAIIMLTVIVRGAVFPLANASYRSFAKMKKVAPKMAEIRVKHASDKTKLQQELIKLYETEKVNPMAGCLPLILQIPIFFAVYKVISISIEMRHAPFFGWIHDLSEKDPLSVFNLFGLLPFRVPDILHVGPWSIAMLILMLLQKQLNPPPTDPIQRDMTRYMPWIDTFILSKFPSGLVIYWTFSNLISLIQQYAIMRQMKVPVYLFAKDEALAHEAEHKSLVESVTEKAKIEKEYLKNRTVEVEEALFDVEDKIVDAVEGKKHVEGEDHFKHPGDDQKK